MPTPLRFVSVTSDGNIVASTPGGTVREIELSDRQRLDVILDLARVLKRREPTDG